MGDHRHGRVEDYTNAFLGMSYLILVMGLIVLWGLWGYPAALVLCAGLHMAINRLGLRLERSATAFDASIGRPRPD